MALSEFEINNEAYLKAGLAWLRACMQTLMPASPASQSATATSVGASTPAPVAVPEARPASLWNLGRKRASEPLLLSAEPGVSNLESARAAFDEAARAQPAPALVNLAARLRLSTEETHLLFLLAAPEIDSGMSDAIGAVFGSPASRAPNFALAMAMFPKAGWDMLSPERPLRALRMIEIHQVGATSLLNAPLRIDERIGAFVKGLNYLDERLMALCSVVQPPAALPASQQEAADALVQWLRQPLPGHLMQLTGADAASKRDVAAAAAAASGRVLLAVAADALPLTAADAEQFVQLWTREAALLPIALLIQDMDVERSTGEDDRVDSNPRRLRLLQRIGAPVLLSCSEALIGFEQSVTIAVEAPLAGERASLWFGALDIEPPTSALEPAEEPDDEELMPDETTPLQTADEAAAPVDESPQADVQRLAAEFTLSASRIAALAAAARSMTASGNVAAHAAWDVCVAHTAGALNGLAQRVAVRATIDDIELPADEKAQVQRLIEHARYRSTALSDYGFATRNNRGLGIAALFHGESGAGKTMAAEAVAHALSLALFRVDLSALMSKYIGETAKNLRRVFDAAESGGAVLLFDEADAVFGKRSEANNSNDHYLNSDLGYLLTRVETCCGVVLLSTNAKHALDPAFTRRLRFSIRFSFPGAPQRKAIWAGVFPNKKKVGALDLDHLARFALTGGSIFNAALAAAHSAAGGRSKVEMSHVLDAIQWELRKLERPLAHGAFVQKSVTSPTSDEVVT